VRWSRSDFTPPRLLGWRTATTKRLRPATITGPSRWSGISKPMCSWKAHLATAPTSTLTCGRGTYNPGQVQSGVGAQGGPHLLLPGAGAVNHLGKGVSRPGNNGLGKEFFGTGLALPAPDRPAGDSVAVHQVLPLCDAWHLGLIATAVGPVQEGVICRVDADLLGISAGLPPPAVLELTRRSGASVRWPTLGSGTQWATCGPPGPTTAS